MKINEFRTTLQAQPDSHIAIELPDGSRVPPSFHVTEVGYVTKRFVDCGGTFRSQESCVLQTWIGPKSDAGHRLTAGKLAHILDLAQPILPASDLPLEVEYEHGVITQFPLASLRADNGIITLVLDLKHTDCLARERCGLEDGGCGGEAEASVEAAGGCADGAKVGCC